MNPNQLLFTFVTLSLATISSSFEGIEEGTKCEYLNGYGKCTKVVDCYAATEQLIRTRRHNFPRCGFSGFNEVVCCPEESTEPPGDGDDKDTNENDKITTTTSKAVVRGVLSRKCTTVCDEYSSNVRLKLQYHILDGVDAKLGEFPHMAAIGFSTEANPDTDSINYECGGTIISNEYILTAAHCLVRRDGAKVSNIRLGKIDIIGNSDKVPAQDLTALNFTLHPEYNTKTKANDIALIKLDKPITINEYVHPACLYDKSDDPAEITITGWGHTVIAGQISSLLQKVNLKTVAVPECNKAYTVNTTNPRTVSERQICALSDNGRKDACQGDSGGPMQIQARRSSSVYSIVGIISYGKSCGGTKPGVYTRVFSYLDWIESIVWP